DGIRDWSVTGVQTCALPILCRADACPRAAGGDAARTRGLRARVEPRGARSGARDRASPADRAWRGSRSGTPGAHRLARTAVRGEIGRESCRERGESGEVAVS